MGKSHRLSHGADRWSMTPGHLAKKGFHKVLPFDYTVRTARPTGCACNAMQARRGSYRMADPLGHILPAVSIDTT
jgi:hypothetical protein